MISVGETMVRVVNLEAVLETGVGVTA